MTRPYTVLGRSADREVWLARRKAMLTASDIAAVAGLNDYVSREDILAEKLGQREVTENENMFWGSQLETAIGRGWCELERRRGGWAGFRSSGVLLASRERPWLGATLDGLGYVRDAGFGVVEIKKPRFFALKKWRAGCPRQYDAQVQAQLYVTGLERAWLLGLCGGEELVVHPIQRDEWAIESLLKAADEFWAELQEARGC